MRRQGLAPIERQPTGRGAGEGESEAERVVAEREEQERKGESASPERSGEGDEAGHERQRNSGVSRIERKQARAPDDQDSACQRVRDPSRVGTEKLLRQRLLRLAPPFCTLSQRTAKNASEIAGGGAVLRVLC